MENDFSKFIGKWCLCKHSAADMYDKIYIAAIKQDIIKYSYDGVNYKYQDLDRFWYNMQYTKVCPFERKITVIENGRDTAESKQNGSKIDGIEWTISGKGLNPKIPLAEPKEKQESCNHEWIYLDYMSYPPIHSRECRKCGKAQHQKLVRDNSSPFGENDWINGAY